MKRYKTDPIGLKRILKNTGMKKEILEWLRHKPEQVKQRLDASQPITTGAIEEAIVNEIGRPMLEIQKNPDFVDDGGLTYFNPKPYFFVTTTMTNSNKSEINGSVVKIPDLKN